MVEIMAMGRRWAARISFALILLVMAVGVMRYARQRGAIFVIERGGTYSGTWESNHPDIPCVRVDTAEPVIIENATVRGPGHLIVSTKRGAKITIRNTRGVGVRPEVAGRC